MKRKKSKLLYQGFHRLEEQIFYNDNREISREVLIYPDACVGLIYHRSREQYGFVEQFRAGADGYVLEGVAGLVDDGESPHETIVREIKEETGCDVITKEYLGSVHQGPATKTGHIHLYSCIVDGFDEPKFDGDEYLVTKWFSEVEMNKLEFKDMKTICLLYYAKIN